MPWTAVFAVVSMLAVQLGIAAACLYAYTRLRHHQDSTGQDRIAWGVKVEAAVNQADSARKLVENIEVEHYKRLRSLVEALNAELVDARARIVALERELKVCQTKLASEERISRRDAQRREKMATPEMPAEPDASDVDTLVRNGVAIPLAPQAPAPAGRRESTFGRIAR